MRTWAAILALLVLLVAGAVWLFLPRIVERSLLEVLERAGVEEPALRVAGIGLGGLEVEGVRIGAEEGVTLERLVVGWSRSLLDGRVERVRLEGLRVRARWTEAGLSVPGLDAVLATDAPPDGPTAAVPADGPSAPPGLPVRTLELADARLELDAPGVATGAQLAGSLRLDEGAPGSWSLTAPDGGLRIRVAEPGPLRARVELALELRLEGGALVASSPECLAVTVEPFALEGVASLKQPLALCVQGEDMLHLEPSSGDWRAAGRLAPAELAVEIPVADADPLAVRARIGAGATAAARGEALESELRIGLEAGLLVWEEIRVHGIAGDLRLEGWPPVSAAPQRLTADGGFWALPFQDGRLDFELDAQGRIRIREGRLATSGGHIRASGVLDPAAEVQRLDVALDALDLGRLLAQLEVPGLAGTGTLDGGVIAVLHRDGLRFEDGRARAREEGGLVYRPPGRPPVAYGDVAAADIPRAALQNFRYTSLRGTLAGEAAGDLRLELRLEGANPDLYDGYPIKLDLNLNGPFLALLESTEAAEDVNEAIRRRLEDKETP